MYNMLYSRYGMDGRNEGLLSAFYVTIYITIYVAAFNIDARSVGLYEALFTPDISA